MTAVEYGPYLTTLILILVLVNLSLTSYHQVRGARLLHLLILPIFVPCEQLQDIQMLSPKCVD
jgi:hypothetical protein